jgi:uncharacterized phiE125 gp8 family phage protein
VGTILVAGPSAEPITYGQVIDHLRITSFDEETDGGSIENIDRLIEAVRDDAQDFTGRKFITQTWYYYLDKWPTENYIELPFNPVQLISSIKYTDMDGTERTLTLTTDYLVDTVSLKNRIVLSYLGFWPTYTLHPVNPIKIEFICGYGDAAEDVPARIRQAMLIQIADLFENPQTIVQGQAFQRLDTYERLLWPHKINWV